MIFNFNYPVQVNTVPKYHRSLRKTLMIVPGQIDVDEISDQEAPLACLLRKGDEAIEYRYRDGEFYCRTDTVPVDSRSAVLPPTASRAVFRDLLLEMATESGSSRLDWHPDLSELFRRFMSNAGLSVGRTPPHLVGISGNEFDLWENASYAKTEDVATDENLDIDLWTERAHERAARHFVLDGALWSKVAEPIAEARYNNYYSLLIADLNIYSAPDNCFVSSPKPYGSWEGTLPEEAGRSYWDLNTVLVPMTEARSLQDFRSNAAEHSSEAAREKGYSRSKLWHFDVFLPEAFGPRRAELELRRQACALVALTKTEVVGRFRPFSDLPRDMRRAFNQLKTLADPELAASTDFDEIAEALAAYSTCWDMQSNAHLLGYKAFNKFAGAKSRSAIAAWQERPIDLSIAPSPLALR